MIVKSYRDLLVWQRSMDLVEICYVIASAFPKEEVYGLTSQLRRAVVSIPANIAEGHTRATRKDYAHFFSIARGSTAELETLVLLAESTEVLARDVTHRSCSHKRRKLAECSRAFTSDFDNRPRT